MSEFTIVLILVVYIIMGIGVYNMWRRIVGDKLVATVIVLWPITLIVTALVPRS